jgi:regulator of sigma E protease
MLGKMLTGDASVKNLSGPISIAQYAGQSAQNGIAAFLWFLGIVSVSLGVLNLLPVPLLDGGHLMYYLVEFVKGNPVSESAQIIGQQIGLTLLFGLMILVFYNDIMRLFG